MRKYIKKIEALMMYRGALPAEGKLEEIVKEIWNDGWNHGYRGDYEDEDVPITRIELCKFCGDQFDVDDMHLHQNGFVCEDCWDERLRSTE